MEQSQLIVIDKPTDIAKILESIKNKEFVAYDSETTGLHKEAEVIGISVCADKNTAYYIILAYWDITVGTLVYIPGMRLAVEDLLHVLKTKKLVMHNAIFDADKAERYFKISLIDHVHTDTMILAHLLDENRRVGLKELGKQYFGQSAADEAAIMKESILKNGGSTIKAKYEMYKADPYLLGKYGAKDALLTYKLFFKLVPELFSQGLDKFFYEEESMPLLRGPTYQLNTTGLRIDVKGFADLKRQLEIECAEDKAFIFNEIWPYIQEKYPAKEGKKAFNIGSSSQLGWLCFVQYKLEFNNLTDTGKEVCKALGMKTPYFKTAKTAFIESVSASVGRAYTPSAIVNGKNVAAKKIREPWHYIAADKKCLEKYAYKHKWIERLLSYQRKMKLISTYLEGIESRHEYGIIYPSFRQSGTTSGRYSSQNPNFQNLPRKDKSIKKLVLPRAGKVFVGADYSQLEPRVFAYVSNDQNLLAAFKSKEDFYSVIGMRVYGITDASPYKDGKEDAFGIKYEKLRDDAKVIALASTYGATAIQLAPTMRKSIEQTALDIEEYFNQFPDVAQMMKDSHNQAMTNGKVTSMFGRPRRIPEALNIRKWYGNASHATIPYNMRTKLNLAVNHRIQSTAASIVNRSAIKFHNDCKVQGVDCKLVLQVHDSLVAECNEADATLVSTLLRQAMETTIKLETIDLEAIPKIGKNLSEV